ncbi:MAG: MerR family transcriptional regulator [Bacteroidetes bacterium]|nr:MerR family transcriptional regulator [Bacteroidota bacterium]
MTAKFSIKDLEALSGIKAHTLRIWEQRYGILKPERTDTNIRYYCNDELKQLLNITLLYNHGFKISKIAALDNRTIINEVNKIVDSQISSSDQIDSLIIAMVELDEKRFEKIISNNVLHHGFSSTIEKVLYPFLHKIGVMWQTGSINPAQEHFISNLIRQKLIVAIDGVVVPEKNDAQKFILFLPENELHELALLYYTYLLKINGHQVIYLGQSVPFDDLKRVVEIRNPHCLVTVFTHSMNDLGEYIKQLGKTFSATKILVSGSQLSELNTKLPASIHIFKEPSSFLKQISK